MNLTIECFCNNLETLEQITFYNSQYMITIFTLTTKVFFSERQSTTQVEVSQAEAPTNAENLQLGSGDTEIPQYTNQEVQQGSNQSTSSNPNQQQMG